MVGFLGVDKEGRFFFEITCKLNSRCVGGKFFSLYILRLALAGGDVPS